MKILLVSTQDYIHHPIPSRHHYIFEELATRHEIHVAHFHVSRGPERSTRLIVDEATLIPSRSPLIHYTVNTPYHFHVFNKILRKEGIDVVVAAHVLAGTAVIHEAKKHHVPVLFDLKDWFPDSAAAYFNNRILQDIVKKAVWTITRNNLSHSDRITTVSPSLVEKLRGLGFSSQLITNGVDPEFFYPMKGDDARRELGIGKDEFVIGFSGSIERWYALDDMIRAMPSLVEYNLATRLLIIGGSLFTDYRAELEQLVRDLGITDKVTFTGIKPYHELPRYIACMDVCTIPLSPPRWSEIALPNKYFEYSACGKPIVMRPIPDVLKMGGDNLFVYRTQEEYVSVIKRLMNGAPTFDIHLENFSWKEKARTMESVLSSLAG